MLMHSSNAILVTEPDVFLKEYIASKQKKTLKDLKGRIRFREDYDYKSMREMR